MYATASRNQALDAYIAETLGRDTALQKDHENDLTHVSPGFMSCDDSKEIVLVRMRQRMSRLWRSWIGRLLPLLPVHYTELRQHAFHLVRQEPWIQLDDMLASYTAPAASASSPVTTSLLPTSTHFAIILLGAASVIHMTWLTDLHITTFKFLGMGLVVCSASCHAICLLYHFMVNTIYLCACCRLSRLGIDVFLSSHSLAIKELFQARIRSTDGQARSRGITILRHYIMK
jgi:hypothetical protein